MSNRGFEKTLSDQERKDLAEKARLCRGDILKMTTLSASGHPGGSMSSIDMYLTVYEFANITPENWDSTKRDRVFVSHGHTSPGVYSALARNGFFDIDDATAYFRLAGSIYEGHIERMVPGVEWSTGNLGQGLSAGCGAAIAGKLRGEDFSIFVFMGDGEQQKGQIPEARRFAVKFGLNNITAFIDYNKLQISGDIADVMPQNIRGEYEADGWHVIEIDGHDFSQIYNAVTAAKKIDKPVLVLANTVMGKDVGFMENIAGYHGKPLTEEQLKEALEELEVENNFADLKEKRAGFQFDESLHVLRPFSSAVKTGTPRTYSAEENTDNRSGFGNALLDVVKETKDASGTPIAVFDCDLAGSVKTGGIEKEYAENFIQSGIQEHHTATCAGAASVNGVISVFADFGVFGVDEAYNQQRLNDINSSNLKVFTTHVGIDVGEDGKTHQCLDYIGAMRNIYGFKVVVPADPNQTDRATRTAIDTDGNWLVAMGRSKVATITDANGKPFFGEGYTFEYGRADLLADGDVALVSCGSMVHRALKVREILAEKGISVAVINMSSPLEPDMEMLKRFADKPVFTYEDHNADTGLGSIIAMKACDEGLNMKVRRFGAESYAYSGKPDDVLKLIGLDPETVAGKIEKEL
ncbi:transketolase [Limisalsivibrio acetivorans]|uniref:transketolase n=1 Tax=Limisalsivibrio acetivorans TaxID=1304888 RepID=UPI0003B6DCF8|nr:transketolase [Limisalsivibrio acetivorans]